jgi:hypothetical protein
LDGREEVSAADFRLVQRVAFDCVPPVRKAILEHLIGGKEGAVPGFPSSTVKYAKNDLTAVGLLSGGAISDDVREMAALARLL